MKTEGALGEGSVGPQGRGQGAQPAVHRESGRWSFHESGKNICRFSEERNTEAKVRGGHRSLYPPQVLSSARVSQ